MSNGDTVGCGSYHRTLFDAFVAGEWGLAGKKLKTSDSCLRLNFSHEIRKVKVRNKTDT